MQRSDKIPMIISKIARDNRSKSPGSPQTTQQNYRRASEEFLLVFCQDINRRCLWTFHRSRPSSLRGGADCTPVPTARCHHEASTPAAVICL